MLLILLFSFHTLAEPYLPRLHQTKCSDTEAVTKEAVAYALLGVFQEFTTPKCFQGEVFRHFQPRGAWAENEVLNPGKILRFDKKIDKYKIVEVTRADKEYHIKVLFTLNGKPLETVYQYVPDPEYTGRTGICGFVVNPTHTVVRSDCFDDKKWANVIKRFRAPAKR